MIAIFAGPTLSKEEIQKVLPQAEIHPPAAAGDLYRVAQSQPDAIGLIDGYFSGVPSVWHKEILWALSAGIPVYGASSMGALRAAELHPFGMIGVGQIFHAYCDGTFEDDDEVAVKHGPKELDYILLSEPMVNIRATLEVAMADGVIAKSVATQLVDLAKALHYPERSWERLIKEAQRTNLDKAALEDFQTWRPTGYVDQKHRDAVAMLSAIGEGVLADKKKTPRSFEFKCTAMWLDLVKQLESTSGTLHDLLILDWLRGNASRYRRFRTRALKRLMSNAGEQEEFTVSHQELNRAINRFRTHHKLYTGQALSDWLNDNAMEMPELMDQLAHDIAAETLISTDPTAFAAALVEEVSGDPEFQAQAKAIEQQQAVLEGAGYRNSPDTRLDLNPTELLLWYFENHLHQAVPNDMDDYLEEFGFSDRSAFEQMMVRQFILWQEGGRDRNGM